MVRNKALRLCGYLASFRKAVFRFAQRREEPPRRKAYSSALHNREVELLLMQIRIGLNRHRTAEVRFNFLHDFALS
jgi:hypothetical protein